MAVELEIRLEGTAPGLEEHRLSLGAFGKSLESLLDAVRRIASGVVRDATGPEYGVRGGAYAKQAKLLDIQLVSVEDGSVRLSLALALQLAAGQADMFQDLPEQAGRAFVEAVEAEGAGRLRNLTVRRYLQALPPGVTAQTYTLSRDGQEITRARVGEVHLTEEMGVIPALLRFDGRVTGVGFPPGKSEVRVLFGRETMRCAATAEQVEVALALRGSLAMITAVGVGKALRLVSIQDVREERRTLTTDERTRAIFTRWEGLLHRLAR